MSGTSGRELLLRTLSQRPGERIPVSPFIHVNYVKEFFGTHDVDWVVKTPEVYQHFGFDIMHRNCSPAYEAYGPETPNWEIEVNIETTGRDETKTTIIHTPGGDLRCVEALRWTYEFDAEAAPSEYLIKTETDLDLMMRYQPNDAKTDASDIVRAREAVGEDGITAPWIQGAFNCVGYFYRKVDDLLIDALLNPKFYDRLMTYCVERYMNHVQTLIDAGPDVLSYGGNIANGKMVSPHYFKEYIWPYEKRLIAFIESQGVKVLYHNCGYARNLLPLYPSLEMSAYESMTPPPYGDTILTEAVKVFGNGTTLLGNIDQIDLLRYGAADEIEARVKDVLDTTRGSSHFILATTDYFNDNTPHDNIHALAEAGRRYGYR